MVSPKGFVHPAAVPPNDIETAALGMLGRTLSTVVVDPMDLPNLMAPFIDAFNDMDFGELGPTDMFLKCRFMFKATLVGTMPNGIATSWNTGHALTRNSPWFLYRNRIDSVSNHDVMSALYERLGNIAAKGNTHFAVVKGALYYYLLATPTYEPDLESGL